MGKNKGKRDARAGLVNPFKPGAGHSPPHLAGREQEKQEFEKLLDQEVITQNIVLTGLRGVGKTVLMDDVYKAIAINKGWVWVGSDFSESAFVDELALCYRLITDLSVFTSTLELGPDRPGFGLRPSPGEATKIDYEYLVNYFNAQGGLNSDKLKATLELAWRGVEAAGKRGILFAYDEAQVVQDRRDKDQYPLALLLEVFQSMQRKGMRAMLLLTGLPTLFPKLVESRTYAERMFRIQEISKLDEAEAREAIVRPLQGNKLQFSASSIDRIIAASCGYPYFIQFICREGYDFLKSVTRPAQEQAAIPLGTLIRKLDADFFAGRWSRVSDRQRELMLCIAILENAGDEFTVNQIVEASKQVAKERHIKPFKTGDVSTMLPKLIGSGLVYKNRHGKYLLAVPLFDGFIKRQFEESAFPGALADSHDRDEDK